MASEGVNAAANSRLTQMQMRFQQRQLQEREQRRIEMTQDAGVDGTYASPPKNIGNGKVRQMFDERRRGAGIDRSNPLKPIVSSTSVKSMATTRSNGNRTSPVVRKQTLSQTVAAKRQAGSRLSTDQSVGKGSLPKNFSSLSLGDNRLSAITHVNDDDRNNNDAHARAKSSNSIKLNPVVTKKSPSVVKARQPTPRQGTPPKSINSNNAASVKKPTRPVPPYRTAAKTTISTLRAPPQRSSGNMSKAALNTQPGNSSTPPGMGTCRFCQRHFNQERLAKHEAVCEKMVHTKRKVYDAAKHRLLGTEAEGYTKKGNRLVSGQKVGYSSAASAIGLTPPPNSAIKKNNWRKKHEEFIAAIRAAKQVQAHLARGGKLSDLPPPPPSENPDYIQCPHCMRRFNQAAAERHIPKCATMIHNKPKPNAAAGRTSKR